MNKKILVTGGAGFIGSHLCEKLLGNENKIINIDNFNNFYAPSIKERNIRFAAKNDNYSLYKVDIRDIRSLNKVFTQHNIDLVVHLAAMAGVQPSIDNPILYNEINITGTLNLLETCKNHNIKKFLFASSSSVYGNNVKTPFSELDTIDFPISPYASTKKSGEAMCHVYHHLYKINIICLRFFTVYGERQRPDLAIHKFTKLIDTEKAIPFFGNGFTQRDYTYIDDIIDGVVKSIEYLNNNKGLYEIFNLGRGKAIYLRQMVETIEKALGKKAQIDKRAMQPGDAEKTFADITKAKDILGYDPKIDFREGIKKFISWYKKK